jgi:hypothetical protein
MRRVKAMSIVFLLGGLAGCCDKAPPAATSQAVATDNGPSKGEVDIIFRGLVSVVFIKTGKYAESVFLNPDNDEHMPLCAISTESIDGANASVPDLVASADDDAGLAIWKFTEASIDESKVSDTSLTYFPDEVDVNKPDYKLLRWVPSMDDIFGATQVVDKVKIDKGAARGTWRVGTLTPVFDRPSHKTQKWDIGNRRGIPVADGLRLRLTLADAGIPLILNLTRGGKDEKIQVHGGGTILMSAYPTTLPKAGDDLKHFHHYYGLIKGNSMGPEPHPHGPTPYPVRCAPSLYLEPSDPGVVP